jgi:biopolymer transport protein ExbD
MLDGRFIIPLIDMLFLTLGAALAAMTQMDRVESLPVEVARIGPGVAGVDPGEFAVLSVDPQGMALDGVPIELADVARAAAGLRVVVRADRRLETQTLVWVLAELARGGCKVSLEVEEVHGDGATRAPAPRQGA